MTIFRTFDSFTAVRCIQKVKGVLKSQSPNIEPSFQNGKVCSGCTETVTSLWNDVWKSVVLVSVDVWWCMLVSVDHKLYPVAIRSIFLLVYSGVWELSQVSPPYKPHIATPQLASTYQKIFQAFLYQTEELVNYFCPTICQAIFHIIVFVVPDASSLHTNVFCFLVLYCF